MQLNFAVCNNCDTAAGPEAVELRVDAGVLSHWKDFDRLGVFTYLSQQAAAPFQRSGRVDDVVDVPMIPQVGMFRAGKVASLGCQALELPLEVGLRVTFTYPAGPIFQFVHDQFKTEALNSMLYKNFFSMIVFSWLIIFNFCTFTLSIRQCEICVIILEIIFVVQLLKCIFRCRWGPSVWCCWCPMAPTTWTRSWWSCLRHPSSSWRTGWATLRRRWHFHNSQPSPAAWTWRRWFVSSASERCSTRRRRISAPPPRRGRRRSTSRQSLRTPSSPRRSSLSTLLALYPLT